MYNHVWHKQICGNVAYCTNRCGLTMECGEFVDSLRISNSNNDPFYTRFKTVNYSGTVMLHCNYFMHEDVEMIDWVNTVGGPNNLPPQEKDYCDAVRQQAKVKTSKGKVKKGVVA